MASSHYDANEISPATKGRFRIEWVEQEVLVLRV